MSSEYLSFTLSDAFVAEYADKKIDWGFPIHDGLSLGELTFISKYSRIKEDGTKERWHESCRRIIEGMFSIQKDWCKHNRTPWNDHKAQRAAKDAYDRLFHFKWTPPGRGMWAMGTRMVHEGEGNSAALFNCAWLSTEKITPHSKYEATLPFVRLMEMSMWGIGVGFDTAGGSWNGYDSKISLSDPTGEPELFIVPDTREGWAESVGKLLASFFLPNQRPVRFDYSEVRPAGSPLKTFGGTASGPGPLKALHEKVQELLGGRDGSPLTSRDIVDIQNLIGKAVVAGGARRSAELALGDSRDTDYINLKNWNLSENADRTGPDGWAWMCLTEDTWIQTAEGPRQIADLKNAPFTAVLSGKEYQSTPFVRTGVDAEVYELVTREGYKLKGTANHPLMSDEGWKNLGDFEAGETVHLNEHEGAFWDGAGTFGEGYLLGHLWGDGSLVAGTGQGVKGVLSLYDEEIVASYQGYIKHLADNLGSQADWHVIERRDGKEARLSSKLVGALSAEYGMRKGNKKFGESTVETASSQFYKGLLSGAFDTDGHVQINRNGGFSLILTQNDYSQLEMMQRMLLRLGIKSSIRVASSGGTRIIKGVTTSCKPAWTLYVGGSSADLFVDRIGFQNPLKAAKAEAHKTTRYHQKFSATVVSVEYVGLEDVWDATVDDVHAFDANGFIAHNSNNSVIANVDSDLDHIIDSISVNGEPGIVWLDVCRGKGRLADPADNKDLKVTGVNPCAEIHLESHELCCLSETYINNAESLDDFLATCKVAMLYAKTVTLLPTPWPETNEVVVRNRRIGVSTTGTAQFAEDRGWNVLKKWFDTAYEHIREKDSTYSEWLGVRESIRKTTSKPAGSTSLLAGCAPGVHWPTNAGTFMRRMRFHTTDPMLPVLEKAGYHSEPDQGDPKHTVVVEFPVDGLEMRSEHQVSMWEKAELAAFTQRWWADNAVSVTVTFNEDERGQIEHLLRSKAGQFKTISFLPPQDSGGFAQAPFEVLDKEEAKVIRKKLKKVNLKSIYDGGKTQDATDSKFCDTESCEILFNNVEE